MRKKYAILVITLLLLVVLIVGSIPVLGSMPTSKPGVDPGVTFPTRPPGGGLLPIDPPNAPLPTYELGANLILIPPAVLPLLDTFYTSKLTISGYIVNPRDVDSFYLDFFRFGTFESVGHYEPSLRYVANQRFTHDGKTYEGPAYVFSVTVDLPEGYLEVRPVVTSSDAPSREWRRAFFVDVTPPTLQVTPEYQVIGAAETTATVEAKVGDSMGLIELRDSRGNFLGRRRSAAYGRLPVEDTISARVTGLKPGLNTVTYLAQDGENTGNVTSQTVQIYRKHWFTLNVTGDGVTFDPSGPVLEEGTEVNFKITVPKRLRIAKVTVNGEDVTSQLTKRNAFTFYYSLTMDSDVDFVVEYMPLDNRDRVPGQEKKKP